MKKNIKKIIKLLTLILTLLLLPINKSYSMGHKEKKFKFENYKTAEEAKAELLRRHPIGSNVDALLETLRGAGAKIDDKEVLSQKDIDYYSGVPANIRSLIYGQSGSYYEQPGIRRYIFLNFKWGTTVFYDKDSNIVRLSIYYWYL